MMTRSRTLYTVETVYIDSFAHTEAEKLRGYEVGVYDTLAEAKAEAKKNKLKAYRITRTDTVFVSRAAGDIIDAHMAGTPAMEAA